MTEADRKLRIFLCHSSNDKPTVRDLYHRLQSEGWIDAWLDSEELYPGQDWNYEIEKAVDESDVILVCLTKNSVSKEGYVQRELRIVLDLADYKPENTLFVIPVRLDECEPPRRLRPWQYADYFPEANRDFAYQRLLVSLRMRAKHLGVKSGAQFEKLTTSQSDEIGARKVAAPKRKDPDTFQKETVEMQVFQPDVVDDKAPVIQTTEWQLPDITTVLDPSTRTLHPSTNEEFFQLRAKLIEDTLASFGAPAQVVEINRGPTITQYGVEPLFIETRTGRTKVRVNKIASLADDIALALAAPRIRIQAVPGHSYVGIEVPNEEMALVALRDILESDAFQRNNKRLRFALGHDVTGHPVSTALEGMPHLLIAGTTGSGKSVCINSILTSFLMFNTPDDLRLILVDPKRVELIGYNGIPHLLSPVVVDMDRVIGVLQWMTHEMDDRYRVFSQVGARNITDYNAKMKLQGGKKLPYLVTVIDELADLMMLAPNETEQSITRLAQLARATGIHLILATQRPSVDVVTGLIKANFPARIAFAVASTIDSRVILDQAGAERLLGRGDMLFQAPDAPSAMRLQGVFVSDNEIQKLVDFWKTQAGNNHSYSEMSQTLDALSSDGVLKNTPMFEDLAPKDEIVDPLLAEVIDLVRKERRASVSLIQRRMRVGYTRAARIMDTMEEMGIVGPPEGAFQVRKILDYSSMTPSKGPEN